MRFYKVFIICSKQDNDSQKHIYPDYYYRQRVRDYTCFCQIELQKLGSCVSSGIIWCNNFVSHIEEINCDDVINDENEGHNATRGQLLLKIREIIRL